VFNSNKDKTRSLATAEATAEIARDADNVSFSLDDVHYALTLARPAKQTVLTNRETAIQGHSRSFVVLMDATYMTSY